jgi:lipoprotein-anchoring transpeptidase ErfK/SrfK
MRPALPLLFFGLALLGGCSYRGTPDPELSALDVQYLALTRTADDDPMFGRYLTDDPTGEAPGTVVVNTKQRQLYLVLGGGKAMRYGVSVGDQASAGQARPTSRERPSGRPGTRQPR